MKLSIEVKGEDGSVIHTVDFEPVEEMISGATESVKTFLKEKFVTVTKEEKPDNTGD